MSRYSHLNPDTLRELLERWDAGGVVWTIELGGMGPGYEQCIQILVMEILRDFVDVTRPPRSSDDAIWKGFLGPNFGEAAVERCNEAVGGFTGAQIGAAKSLAARVLRVGWPQVFYEAGEDRHIMVCTSWPKTPAQHQALTPSGGPKS